ncbi:hypothetical protein EGI09_10925 [Bacillus subtilis]|nr:hypothetical protein [Bacillus subtilis]
MGALFLFLKSAEYLKKQHKTKKLVEKTSFSLQAENAFQMDAFFLFIAKRVYRLKLRCLDGRKQAENNADCH